jgi:hypothetical protein
MPVDLEALARQMEEKAVMRHREANAQSKLAQIRHRDGQAHAYRDCARMLREAGEKNAEKGEGER